MRKISIHGGVLDVEYIETTNELALVVTTPDSQSPELKFRLVLDRLETSRFLRAIGDVLVSMGQDEKRVVDPEVGS